MAQLRSARKMSDVDPTVKSRCMMRLRRALDLGHVPADLVAEYTSMRRDGRESLAFLLRWAEGRMPEADARLEQHVRKSTVQADKDKKGWYSWHELMAKLNGYASWEQRKYVDSIWNSQRHGAQRRHPDAPQHTQRRFWVSTEEAKARERARSTEASLECGLEGGSSLEQLLGGLEAPFGGWPEDDALPAQLAVTAGDAPESSEASSPPQKRGANPSSSNAKRRKAGASSSSWDPPLPDAENSDGPATAPEPPKRVALQDQLYSQIPKLMAMRQKLKSPGHRASVESDPLAKACLEATLKLLDKHAQSFAEARRKLEDLGSLPAAELAPVQAALDEWRELQGRLKRAKFA